MRKVMCRTCGKLANYSDEYGPHFNEPLCGCGTKSESVQDLSKPDNLEQWRDRFHSCPCCGSQTECFHSRVIGESVEKLRADIKAPPTLRWQTEPVERCLVRTPPEYLSEHCFEVRRAPVLGFETDWKPTKPEAPDFKCRQCGSDNVWYRDWESPCGGFEDTKYECRGCQRVWWFEGADA